MTSANPAKSQDNIAGHRAALARAAQMLPADAAGALAIVDSILADVSILPQAELLRGQALRQLGRTADAVAALEDLATRHSQVPAVSWELAQAASTAGAHDTAITALTRLTGQLPAVPGGWFLLARELRAVGRAADAWRADLSGTRAAANDAELIAAAVAMNDDRLDEAAAMVSARLARDPDDAPATRLLGEICWRRGDMDDALAQVTRAVALAPGFDLAREFLIRLLMQSNRLTEALAHAETLRQSPVNASGHALLHASVLVRLGEQEPARIIYEDYLATTPEQPMVWQNLGHVHKTLGRQADAVTAYREAVTRQPSLGEAWWSLANLKTGKLGSADIATMNEALASLAGEDTRAEDVFHLHFSLGKAHEDAGDVAAAFRHYSEGNARRRALIQHDADDFSAEISAAIKGFSPAFFAQTAGSGHQARDPIFIVGLPRAGSTLIEQILASHSQIEGTMELPEMMMIGSRLQSRIDAGEFADFGAMLASLSPDACARLGEEYLDRTRIHRKTDRPLFIDKMPNNWQHAALIKLILPGATIIDARRHPMGCCFSAWKQHFARGQSFSYDLVDVGRYYREYVRFMAHIDAVRPGAVHRVIYEQMVADTEVQVTRLLAHVGVDFEPACLTFWQTDRAVRTASSEQVRQPIFTDGVDHWKRFADWLGPLADTLGDVSDTYPEVPPSLRAT